MDTNAKQLPVISPGAAGLLQYIRQLDNVTLDSIRQELHIPIRVLDHFQRELMLASLITVDAVGENLIYSAGRHADYRVSELSEHGVDLLHILGTSPRDQWTLERLCNEDSVLAKYTSDEVVNTLYELKLARFIELEGKEEIELYIYLLDSKGQWRA